MDEATTEILIELVKEKECLWNFCHPEYKSVKRKIKAWNFISVECGVPIETCKKKWKGLRDSYAREISKTNHDIDETTQCWKYRENMSFIKDQIQRKKNIGPYHITEETYDSATESYPLTFNSEDKQDIFEYSPAEHEFDNSFLPSSSSSRRAKVPKINAEESFISTMKSVEDFLEKQGQRTQAVSNHSALSAEDEYFCRSLVEKLSRFPLIQKNEAKMKMMQCLCDMEAELYQT